MIKPRKELVAYSHIARAKEKLRLIHAGLIQNQASIFYLF